MNQTRFILIFLAMITVSFSVLAQEAQTSFFDVYYQGSVDFSELYDRLSFVPQSTIEVFSVASGSGAKEMFLNGLENLYMAVCDIMDIHLSLDTRVKLYLMDDKLAVVDQVEQILGKRVDSPSFYYRDKDTIYISVTDFTAGILGHELGHFVIDQYFPVPPPEKMQEVLCGYVEYTLLKQKR